MCDVVLDDFELTFKHLGSNEYTNECMSCIEVGISDLDDLTPFIDDDISYDSDYPSHDDFKGIL